MGSYWEVILRYRSACCHPTCFGKTCVFRWGMLRTTLCFGATVMFCVCAQVITICVQWFINRFFFLHQADYSFFPLLIAAVGRYKIKKTKQICGHHVDTHEGRTQCQIMWTPFLDNFFRGELWLFYILECDWSSACVVLWTFKGDCFIDFIPLREPNYQTCLGLSHLLFFA